MARVIDAILSLKDKFSPTLKNVSRNLEEQSKIHKRLGKDIENTGKSISGVSAKMALFSAPFIAAAAEGLKLNSEFTDGLAKVSTALNTTVVDMSKIRQGLLDISNATGVSVVELTNAEYQCLSAGVDASKSVEFLSKATKTAKAGFADSSTAINALTTVLNAYGMESERVTDISDQMLTAQNFGKTTFADMGQSLGNVIPIAATLNVSTKELFASIATLTRNGVQTSEAITGLKAAYSNILKPSGEAEKMAQKLGLQFNSAHLQSVGWAKFLQEIKEKTGGNAAQMAQLFGSVEALNSVMVLAGKGSKDFSTALDMMNNSSGATEEAYNKLLTPAEQARIAMNQLKNASMELGQGLTPILKATATLVKQFAKYLNELTPEQKEMATQIAKSIIVMTIFTGVLGKTVGLVGKGVGAFAKISDGVRKAGSVTGYIATRFSTLITVFKAVGTAARFMFMNPIGIAISAVVIGAYLIYDNWGKLKAFFINLWSAVVSIFNNAVTALKGYLEKIGVLDKLQVLLSKMQTFFTVFMTFWINISTGILNIVKSSLSPIVDFFSWLWNSIYNSSSSKFTAISALINWIAKYITTGFNVMCNIVADLLNGFLANIGTVINGVIDVFSGIITFLTGVFTGNWSMAWQGLIDIFSGIFNTISGICSNVMGTVKSIINDVISGINSISIDIPEWVPNVGGKHFQTNIPMLANGTDNWRGGAAMIHDAGPEIVDLPNGSRVIPHSKSMQQEYERGRKEGTGSGLVISIPKLADTLIIREDADIDRIVEQLAIKIKSYAINQAQGAI